MKTEWLYGNHRNLGWGAVELNTETFEYLDFNPEWEMKRDVKYFWINRKHILKLKNMTILKYIKYIKLLYKGLVRYKDLS